MKFFIIFGVLGLLFKSYRFVYVLIYLESCMVGLVLYLMSFLTESMFFFLLSFSLVSSITGLLVVVLLLTCYGSDYVKF